SIQVMERFKNAKNNTWGTAIRVGAFLAWRDVKGASKWTTSLIIFIMTLTFLNLVVVSGILVGLIQGSVGANRDRDSGDGIISPFLNKTYVDRSTDIIRIVAATPGVKGYTARYVEGGKIEGNYKATLKPGEIANAAGSSITGIDPVQEDSVTHLSKYIIEGTY